MGIAFRHVEPPHQVVRTLGDPGCMKHHFGNRDSFTRNRRFTEGLENYQFWVQKPETDNSQYIESWNYSISLVQHLVQSKVSSNHLLHPHVPGSVGPLFLKLQTYSLVRIVQPELYWLKQLEALRGLMVLRPAAKSAWKGSGCMR